MQINIFKLFKKQSTIEKAVESYNKLISDVDNKIELLKSEYNEFKSIVATSKEINEIEAINIVKSFSNELESLNNIRKSSFDDFAKNIKGEQNEFAAKYKAKLNDSLGKSREDMPQISEKDIDSFLIHFSGNSNNASVKKVKIKLSKLKPSQNELNDDKVIEGLTNNNWKDRNYIVSEDNYLLDGHHSWASGLEIDPEKEVTVYKVSLPARELIRRSNLLKITKTKDIDDNVVKSLLSNFVGRNELAQYLDVNYDTVISPETYSKINSNSPIAKSEIIKGELTDIVFNKSNLICKSVIVDSDKPFCFNFYTLKKSEIEKSIKQTSGESKKLYADIIVKNNEGKILLLKRSASDNFGAWKYGLPGGNVEENETVGQAVRRELFEETNLEVEKIDFLTKIDNNDNSISHYFFAQKPESDIIAIDSNEHDNYVWVNKEEWNELELIGKLKERLNSLFDEKKDTRLFGDVLDSVNNVLKSKISKSEVEDNNIYVTEDVEHGFIVKSVEGDFIGISEENYDYLEKSNSKDINNLQKKSVYVTRDGHTFLQTVYVKKDTGESVETPVGAELSPTISGLEIEKYSDKSIAIKGETYVNKDLMRKIKDAIGSGLWNPTIKGWIFPLSKKDQVLGIIYSQLKNEGKEDEAEAVKNQKNEFDTGTKVTLGDIAGVITAGVSDNNAIKYNVKLEDGTDLKNVNESVISVEAEKNDAKISETISSVVAENRSKSEKKIYGIKPVSDIYKYSLVEYFEMHGLTSEDYSNAIKSFNKDSGENKTPKTRTTNTTPREKTDKEKSSELTKQQLIKKLIKSHYQDVKNAIERGEEVPEKSLELYSDLKEAYNSNRKPMSEETKEKIREYWRRRRSLHGLELDVDKIEPIAVPQTVIEKFIKEDYKPKDGQEFTLVNRSSNVESVTLKTKDYTDIPPVDISIPKSKNILNTEKPYFIQDIDLKKFAKNGYRLSAVKIGDDKYLVALNGFNEKSGAITNYTKDSVNMNGNYSIMTLDLYTATQEYYQIKAKEELKIAQKKEYDEKIEKYSEKVKELRLGGDDKRADMYQKWIDAEKPSKSRLPILSDDKMNYDQFNMIAAIKGIEKPLSKLEIWQQYNLLNKNRTQKKIDLELYSEDNESSYTKGKETSYGDSNTKDNLLESHGVMVKRQNGDEINEKEIESIKKALDSVSEVFGNNINLNKDFGLKISHSGNVLMHASKAVGIFVPRLKAIGVSNSMGSTQFNITLAHEYAHFVDYQMGKNTNNSFASDKEGSTANEIASVFRKNMNEKSDSDYQNRTCECFARAFEQYYSNEVLKYKSINAVSNYANEKTYEDKIKPLIQQFLSENKEFLKSIGFDFEYFEKAEYGVYSDNYENRKLNRVGQKYSKDSVNKNEEKESNKSDLEKLNKYAKEASDKQLQDSLNSGKLNETEKEIAEKELNLRESKKEEKGSKAILTEQKKLGRSGKFIQKTATNPAQIYKGVTSHLDSINQKYDFNFSKTTSSRYIKTEDANGNVLEVRFANHSPAISDIEDWKGIEVGCYLGGELDIKIDTSFGYKTEDVKSIFEIVKDSSIKTKNYEPKVSYDELYNIEKKEKETLIQSELAKLKLEDDEYDINRSIVKDKLDSIKLTDKYKEFVKNKIQEEAKNKEKMYFNFGDIEVTDLNSIIADSGIVFSDKYSGSANKKTRKDIKDYLFYEIGNKLKKNEITKDEYVKLANEFIDSKSDSIKKSIVHNEFGLGEILEETEKTISATFECGEKTILKSIGNYELK